MNILLITKNYPPAICGVGDHSERLKTQWEKWGHEVWIYTTFQNTNGREIFNSKDKFFSAAMGAELEHIIVSCRIDQLFWQYVPYSYQEKGWPVYLPGLMLQIQKLGVRQSVFFHEVSLRLRGDGWRQSILAFLQRRIARRIARIANHSFTSIPLYRSYFKRNLPSVVPVGSNLPVPTAGEILPYHIVCFANRADQALLDAIQRLRQTMPVKLLLCGSVTAAKKNQLEAWLKQQQAESWLAVTGAITPEKLSNCIATAAVFIQPQITDQKGRGGISAKNGTIMAAMSMGKPIITCAGDMTDRSIFRNEENMLLVPYGDPEAYYRVLHRMLSDPGEAGRLALAARDTYEQYASWDKIAGQLADGFGKPTQLPTTGNH